MPSGTCPTTSSQFAAGARNHAAPEFRAPTSFCWIPPMGPTTPAESMVPVPATRIPPVIAPGVSLSTMPRANIIPALGPPTSSIWIVTSNGNSYRGSIRTPSSVCPWGPSSVRTATSSSSPSRTTPTATGSPGSTSCSTSRSSGRSSIGVLPADETTSPSRSCASASEPALNPTTVSVVGTAMSSSSSAAAVAFSCEETIASAFCSCTSSCVVSGSKSCSSGTTAVAGSSQPRTRSERSTSRPGPPNTDTVVRSSVPSVG